MCLWNGGRREHKGFRLRSDSASRDNRGDESVLQFESEGHISSRTPSRHQSEQAREYGPCGVTGSESKSFGWRQVAKEHKEEKIIMINSTGKDPWKPWNRSSAFSPETLAILTNLISQGVPRAIAIFDKEPYAASLTYDERADAIQMIAQGISDGVTEFSETLKR
jgi:hypothetical protein